MATLLGAVAEPVVPEEVARRKRLAQQLRAARTEANSTTGLKPEFDLELMRLYAHNRATSWVAGALLAAFIAGTQCFMWLPSEGVALSFIVVLLAEFLALITAKNFIKSSTEATDISQWRRRFLLTESLTAFAWCSLILGPLSVNAQDAQVFVVFSTLIVAAVNTMVGANIPSAAMASILPLVTLCSMQLIFINQPMAKAMSGMTIAAGGFFIFLAFRFYRSTLDTIEHRAEKDALIGELEQAKANSDEARRRAEEASLAKSRFLATMSHELRTPLNAILGFSEVMRDEVFGAHTVRSYADYSKDIHSSGKHLLNLINEILDLSRVESGHYELNEEATSLIHIVEDCHHLLKLRAKSKNITIKEMFETTLPRLWADERAVRQVTLNLLSNAIKFTPPQGEIVIKVGWTSSGGQYLSVKDNGPGIPEDEIATVLQTFGRGSLAIKTAEQGSGLGLPIVKGLMDLHGGQFNLRSKLREGTEVIISFPPSRVMDTLSPIEQSQPIQLAKAS
jgi:two-component system, cell cycle sensor histidine kinase PleC